MERKGDESGVSGIGVVLEGVEFSDGRITVRWLPGKAGTQSTAFYDNFDQFWHIHVESHPTNGSVVRFSDGTERQFEIPS